MSDRRQVWETLADLLARVEAGNVTPIPTVDHPFDPHRHVAVATTSEADVPPGTVVREERRGYRTPDGVLRYAEVIVHRPASDRPDGEPATAASPEE
ncbi:MAG: nucleotide exchange factor GrpE [Chloroflexota bacterium]